MVRKVARARARSSTSDAYSAAIPRSVVARATAIASSVVEKKGQRSRMRRTYVMPRARSSPSSARPAPNHPGTAWRDWFHAKTHGMARRSSIEACPVRLAGREPSGRAPISSSGVDWEKYSAKTGGSHEVPGRPWRSVGRRAGEKASS